MATRAGNDFGFAARKITWRWQQHDYSTYDSNYYSTYDAYVLVRAADGKYLLFADLGDKTLPYVTSHANCVAVMPNGDSTYDIYGLDCGELHVHASGPLVPVPGLVSRISKDARSWHKFPYSQALCQTMKLSYCP